MKNTRSGHRLRVNSLQMRTVCFRAGGEHHQGYNEIRKIGLFDKPLIGFKFPSHPTQDIILQFYFLKTVAWVVILTRFIMCNHKWCVN